MFIYKDYKYELNPNNVQRTHFYQHAGAARFAYNWALNRVKSRISRPNAMQLNKEWNVWKHENAPWWNQVSKWAPQSAFQNLQIAFEKFFNKKTRYPKFKSKKRSRNSFRFSSDIKVVGIRHIQLPRLGLIKLKEAHNVEGRILAATITERANRWFVSIRTQQEIDVPENQGPSIGVDLGVKVLATLSNGQMITGPKAHKSNLKLQQRINRKWIRTEPGSKRRERVRRRLAKLHYRISCIRNDATHKFTSMLAKTYGTIGIEDLNVAGMVRNHSLARSISDMGFGEFRRQLEYKTKWYGSKLVIHGRFFASSKTCSSCGVKKDMFLLSERIFECSSCGLKLDRDVNAAINLNPCGSPGSGRGG